MDEKNYNSIVSYLKNGTLPLSFSSTKGNFIRQAQQFHVNPVGRLMFGNRIVLKLEERAPLFAQVHNHSGRDACWKRIKDR